MSILAEPSVSVVDKVVDKRGTRKVAEAYLNYLYTPEGQDIAGKHYYRPRDEKVAEKYESQFSPVKLFTIDEVFGGWSKATEIHFKDGGVFDQIYVPGAAPCPPELRVKTSDARRGFAQINETSICLHRPTPGTASRAASIAAPSPSSCAPHSSRFRSPVEAPREMSVTTPRNLQARETHMYTTLIVPGLHSSGPDHWQTWFEQQIPSSVRVIQRDWKDANLPDWASRVRREISRNPGPIFVAAIASAHSPPCRRPLTTAIASRARCWLRQLTPSVSGSRTICRRRSCRSGPWSSPAATITGCASSMRRTGPICGVRIS